MFMFFRKITVMALLGQIVLNNTHADIKYLDLKWEKSISTRPGESVLGNESGFQSYDDRHYKVFLTQIPNRLYIPYGYTKNEREKIRYFLSADPVNFHQFRTQLQLLSKEHPCRARHPFTITPLEDAFMVLHASRSELQGKTLNVLRFDGGHGNFVRGLPVLAQGFLLPDVLWLACFLNSNVREKLDRGLLRELQNSCETTLANTTLWEPSTYYSIHGSKYIAPYEVPFYRVQGENVMEERISRCDGVSRHAFITIYSGLSRFATEHFANSLQLKTKVLYTTSCFSASFVPILEPLVDDNGIIICSLSDVVGLAPIFDASNNLLADSIMDIMYLDERYKTSPKTPNLSLRAFFDWCEADNTHQYDRACGFFPYGIVTKQGGVLTLHYFYDPSVLSVAMATNEKFATFVQVNPESNNFQRCLFLHHTKGPANESYDEHCLSVRKTMEMLDYLQRHNIRLQRYNNYEAFKESILGLLPKE